MANIDNPLGRWRNNGTPANKTDLNLIEKKLKEVIDVVNQNGLGEFIKYNPKTNTVEIGTNMYVDGQWNGHVLTEYDGTKVVIYPLTNDMNIFYVLQDNIGYYGIGYVRYGEEFTSIIGVALSDINDEGGKFNGDIQKGTEQLQIGFNKYIQDDELGSYQTLLYEHHIHIKSASETTPVNIRFDISTESNVAIDSIQDLTTYLKNRKVTVSGFVNQTGATELIVGTSITNSSILYGPSDSSVGLASVGTLTIADEVTAKN